VLRVLSSGYRGRSRLNFNPKTSSQPAGTGYAESDFGAPTPRLVRSAPPSFRHLVQTAVLAALPCPAPPPSSPPPLPPPPSTPDHAEIDIREPRSPGFATPAPEREPTPAGPRMWTPPSAQRLSSEFNKRLPVDRPHAHVFGSHTNVCEGGSLI
jgi:hypothetical protein